ncbi:MAG: glycerophosphodiester phosphodiesterase family protein [Marinilabiliales bacterium]|nr:glycerophosphodiester phosphodiesterase family protein [Marinilabiliales bacterium]
MKSVNYFIVAAVLATICLQKAEAKPRDLVKNKQEAPFVANPGYQRTKEKMAEIRKSNRQVAGIATHRAANEFAPENTLAAIRCALDFQVDYIEIDVRQTSDGYSVLLHDGNLDRTTNGKGPVRNMPFKNVRELSAGSWFDPGYASEKVPTLEEACQMVAEHNRKSSHPTYFYVDCKDIQAEFLVNCLQKHRLLESSVFYLNSMDQIDKLRSLAPMAKLMPGLGHSGDLDHMIDQYKPYALDVDWKDLSAELIQKAHKKGVKIFSDGFGSSMTPESYKKAILAGIDVISTNKVSVFCDALESIAGGR